MLRGNHLNNSLFNNEEFVTHLTFFFTNAKEKHRKKTLLEMIKMEIRDFCIRFSKRLAKVKRKREIDSASLYINLNERHDQNHRDANLVVEVEHVRLEPQKNSEHETKGAKIRSRAR